MGRHRRTARAIEWEAESSSLSLSPEGDGGDVSDVDAHNDVTQPEEVESVPDDVVNAQEQVDDVQEDLPHVEETVQEEPEFPLAPTPITVTSDLPGEESNSYNELDDLVDVPDYNNIEWLYQDVDMSDDDSQPREADLAFADTYSDTDDTDQDSIPGDTPGSQPMRRDSVYTGQPIETIRLAAYLFCAKANISRTSYSRLKEMLSLLKQANGDPVTLPEKIDTLCEHIRDRIPLLKIMKKQVYVKSNKLPTLPEQSKMTRHTGRLTYHYWYDPIDLFTHILSASELTSKMFFGMGQLTDNGTEFWHSRAWASSTMTTSGHFAYTQSGADIFPGDIVTIEPSDGYTKARVLAVQANMRPTSVLYGEIVITCQPVVEGENYRELSTYTTELVIVDQEMILPAQVVLDRLPVEMLWKFHPENPRTDQTLRRLYRSTKQFIRYMVDPADHSSRAIRFTHPTRGDLEVRLYGRAHLETFTVANHNGRIASLPFMLFVDDFGIFRNAHYSIKGWYVTPASLGYRDRRSPANHFTLTLGPHGASMDDTVDCLEPGLQLLANGTMLNINGVEYQVRAFPFCLTGDMPRMHDSSGFLRHNATYGCRSCLCPRESRGDLEYDTVGNGRFHFDTLYHWEESANWPQKEREAFLNRLGMHNHPPAILRITGMLCLILGRAFDAPHSEWRGLGRRLVTLLLEYILTDIGVEEFTRAFQEMPFPTGWNRIQSPLHLFQWNLSETDCAVILLPFIFIRFCKRTWFKNPFYLALERLLKTDHPFLEHCDTGMKAVSALLRIIAHEFTLTCARYEDAVGADRVHEGLIRARQCYILLVNCAESSRSRTLKLTVPVNVTLPDNEDEAEEADDGTESRPLQQTQQEFEASMQPPPPPAQSSNAPPTASQPSNAAPPPQTGRRRSSKWDLLRSLPTIHIGLHIADTNNREFAHLMNPTGITDEQFHSYFKSWADLAQPPDLMSYLFNKDQWRQSLRLGLAGAWREYQELQDSLDLLREQCPDMLDSLIPVSERINERYKSYSLYGGDQFKSIRSSKSRTSITIPILNDLDVYDDLTLCKLEANHPFIRSLYLAFQRYNIRNIIQFTKEDKLVWREKVSMTMVDGGSRWTYRRGDFVKLEGLLCRLEQFFSIRFLRTEYVFVIATRMEQAAYKPSLKMLIYTTDKMEVFGLVELAPGKEFMAERRSGGGYYHCEWRLDFF